MQYLFSNYSLNLWRKTLHDLHREGDISVEDNLEGMATGSKSSTVLSENAELKALLTSMNETMKAMSESLRGSGDKPNPKPAKSAKQG